MSDKEFAFSGLRFGIVLEHRVSEEKVYAQVLEHPILKSKRIVYRQVLIDTNLFARVTRNGSGSWSFEPSALDYIFPPASVIVWYETSGLLGSRKKVVWFADVAEIDWSLPLEYKVTLKILSSPPSTEEGFEVLLWAGSSAEVLLLDDSLPRILATWHELDPN